MLNVLKAVALVAMMMVTTPAVAGTSIRITCTFHESMMIPLFIVEKENWVTDFEIVDDAVISAGTRLTGTVNEIGASVDDGAKKHESLLLDRRDGSATWNLGDLNGSYVMYTGQCKKSVGF